MNPILIGMLAGAALGGVKHFASDKPKEKRQRELAATTQQLSPWTGMQAGPIQEADLLGSMMSTSLAGGATGKSMGESGAASTIVERGGTPDTFGSTPMPQMQMPVAPGAPLATQQTPNIYGMIPGPNGTYVPANYVGGGWGY